MGKKFLGVALSVLILGFLSQGCALYTKKYMVDTINQGGDQAKTDFVQSQSRPSMFHVPYQANVDPPAFRFGNPKPKMDWQALNSVKKVAIVGFDIGILGAMSQGQGSVTKWDMTPINEYASLMYDDLKAALEKNGYQVTPVEKVLNNAYYQSLDWKIEEYKGRGVGGIATAHGLKKVVLYKVGFFDLFKLGKIIRTKLDEMQKLAQELDVDAVIVANCDMEMGPRGVFSKKAKVFISNAEMNVFASNKAELMYSLKIPKSDKNMFTSGFPVRHGGFVVATETTVRKGFWDVFWGNLTYKLAELGPDMAKTYKGIAELLAFKMAKDEKDALSKIK